MKISGKRSRLTAGFVTHSSAAASDHGWCRPGPNHARRYNPASPHVQAADLSRLRTELTRAKKDLRAAEDRLALRESSNSLRDDVRKAVSRLAGDKVRAVAVAAINP